MSNVTIFVYGTLKTGLENNYMLTDNAAKSLGPAQLQNSRFALLNGRSFPSVRPLTDEQRDRLLDAGMDSFIWGELFEVHESVMPTLDRLERYPDMYNREEVEVHVNKGNGNKVKAWMYFMEQPVQEDDDVCMNGEWWPRVEIVRLNQCYQPQYDYE